MKFMRLYRLDLFTGSKLYPAMQDGYYVLCDPKNGNQKHRAKNKVLVRDEQKVIDLIMKVFRCVWGLIPRHHWLGEIYLLTANN